MKNIFNKHKKILSLILALSMVASAFTSSYISSHADEKIMDSISGKTAESVREEVRETQGNTEDKEAGGEIPDASIDSISEISDIENTDNKKDSDDDGKNSDDSENKDDIDSGNSKESVDDKESGDNKVSPERNESGDTYESGEDKGSEVSVNNVNNEATVTDNLEKSDKEKEPDKNSDSSENTEEPEAGDNPGITDYSADAIIMNDVANASEKYEISGNKNDSDKTNKKGEKKDQNDDETAPTFDRLYDGVSTAGLNFSGRELLIATSDPAVFTADTEVVSEYKGVYLTRYKDAAQCESAYTYYFNKVSFIDVNSSVKAMSGEADLTNLNNESDSISNINDMTPVNCSGCIALIDSGAAGKNVMKSVSVLGGSAGDDNGHGTMMAASISAANPGARILSIKALNSSATGKVADIYAAIQYAIASNVSIINMSLCSQISADSDILRNAISQARERGIHVVAAAGNNGKDASYYVPAGIPGVTTIGACDARGLREGVSNFGSCVDYYVFADSTSIASARFSGYLLADGPNKVIEREDVFTREMVETAREYASETDAEEYATETDAPAAGDDDIVIKGTYINATKEFPYAINARCTVNCAPYTIDPATNSVHGHYYNYVGAPYNPVLVSIVDSGYSKSDYKNFSCKETRCNSPGKAIPFQSNSVNTISGQVYLTSVVKNPDGSKTATYTSEYFQGGYVPVASGGQYIRVTFTMDYEKKPAFAASPFICSWKRCKA